MKERIVFMGTASFSLEVLKMLLNEKYNVVGVVSQPDRFVGRKKVLTMPDVKVEALKYDIPVIQPQRIKEDYQAILDLKPDLIITAAYGQIIPQVLLDAPRLGCVNVHASLLPLYRGGAPVHYAIIDGQKETGVTIMYMAKKMDAGDMIAQRSIDILEDDNVGVLYDRLSIVGAELLKDTLPSILNETNDRIVQDESLVTYAPTISRDDEKICWECKVDDVYNKVRGMNPWPVAYTTYQGQSVKVWHGYKEYVDVDGVCGSIVDIRKDAIGVKVLDGVYWMDEIQVAGKKKMAVKDLLNGHHMFEKNAMFE